MNQILQVDNLNFSYQKNEQILDSISFSASKNEIIGIIGRNGSGKTTLLNTIAGFQKNYEGNIFINGFDIKEMNLKTRAKTFSYIQQKNLIIPEYYIAKDFVLEGRRPFRNFGFYKMEDYELLDKVLDNCDLLSYKDKKINELSGGEIQRCIFARAIIKNSNLYLLDEPCSAMDIKYQKDFFSLTKTVKENSNSTILITIHDINLAVQNCDRILLLNKGKLIFNGKPEEITEKILTEAFGIPISNKPKSKINFFY